VAESEEKEKKGKKRGRGRSPLTILSPSIRSILKERGGGVQGKKKEEGGRRLSSDVTKKGRAFSLPLKRREEKGGEKKEENPANIKRGLPGRRLPPLPSDLEEEGALRSA